MVRPSETHHAWDTNQRYYRAAAVESKVRQLVAKLETIDTLARIHPFTKGFDKTYYTINMQEHGEIVLGNVTPTVANRTEEEAKQLGGEESQTIYTTTYYIGLEIARLTNSKLFTIICQPSSDGFIQLRVQDLAGLTSPNPQANS